MINGLMGSRGIEKPTKRAGPRGQGMMKTQLEMAEVKKSSLCPHICSMHCALNAESPRPTLKKNCDIQPVKIEGQGEVQTRKWYQMIYHSLPHGSKSTRPNKIHISTRNDSLTEGNLLLENMSEYPVLFTMLTNNISSDVIPIMVVPFILVTLH